MIILFTSENPASANIAKALIERHRFVPDGDKRWSRGDVRLIDTESPSVLDVPADLDTDLIIVLSTHRSRIEEKIMTAHFPGNWGDAELGGRSRTLCVAAAGRLKILLQEIKKEADRIGWKCSLEADHHGPTGATPMIFAEIGSGEAEWNDPEAALAMANAIVASLSRDDRYQAVFGIGGGHYPKVFTRLMLETDLAIGHILPKYAIDNLDEEMFRQALEKTVEKVWKVLVVKDETNAAQKGRISELARKAGIDCEFC
ncbi:MAG: D-aminoacyl-tRNA deacylase [Candidatus Micrarchaeia archaeon]